MTTPRRQFILGAFAGVHGPIDYGPLPVVIGADFGARPVADHFPGQLDQLAIWGMPLSPEAIAALHNDGKGTALP